MYGKRPFGDIVQDIQLYAARSPRDKPSGLEMHGIFVDETVNHFSEEAKRYLDGVDRKVKESGGMHGKKIVRLHFLAEWKYS